MSGLDDRLLPVFARQHWLVTLADVRAAGGDHRAASRRVVAGIWEKVDVGVYRLAAVPPSWEARALAPILALGPGAVASHACAAALHEVPGFGHGTPELSVPRDGGGRLRASAIIHTSTDLDRCARVLLRGIPTTDINRTVLDLARRTGAVRLTRLIEWARRERLTTWDDLIQTLARHARCGRPGIRRLRGVILANMHRDEVTDSDFELLVLTSMVERGLPEPVLHHKVFVGDRFVAEVDLAYPELRIAIELDGRVHLLEEVWDQDLPRQNDLVLCGWTILRFSWARFAKNPDRVMEEIRLAITTAQQIRRRS
jgi:very-short-patch-repair endonuclease